MKQSVLRYCNSFLAAVLALSTVLLGMALLAQPPKAGAHTAPIAIAGTVQREGEAPEEIGKTIEFSDGAPATYWIRGHLTRDVPAGETLLLRAANLRVTVMVNGKTVYAFGRPETLPSFVQSPGNAWLLYPAAEGITAGEDVEIRLETVYAHGSGAAVTGFLRQMATGSEDALRQEMLRAGWSSLLVGGLAAAFGLLTLFGGLFSLTIRFPFSRSALSLSGLLLTGGVWIFIDFRYISLLVQNPVFVNVLARVTQFAIPIFAALYVRSFMTGFRKKLLFYDGMRSTLFLLIAVLLQMLGKMDLYRMQTISHIGLFFTVACCVYAPLGEARAVKQENRTVQYLLLSILPAGVGALLDAVTYLFSLSAPTVGFNIGFLFFALMQVVIVLYALQDAAKRALKLENDLLQARISMMMSQIQPHFLYNSLTAIKQLCATDPARAEECIGSFASYLRTNLDSIGKSASIPFMRELAHTKQYLHLERMRFGDRVKVAYDLRYTGFSLPSLTMQPLVENAVRYGVTKKREGGTVTIYADETEEAYVVRVSDDGAGFDPQEKPGDGERSHIGIENVRSRLAALCKGTLEIVSAPGEGTAATIRIPKEEADVV